MEKVVFDFQWIGSSLMILVSFVNFFFFLGFFCALNLLLTTFSVSQWSSYVLNRMCQQQWKKKSNQNVKCEREQNNEPMRFFVVVAFVFFYIFFFRNEFAPVFFSLLWPQSQVRLFVCLSNKTSSLLDIRWIFVTFWKSSTKKTAHFGGFTFNRFPQWNHLLFFLIFAHFSELATVSVWVKETISCAFQEE